MDVIWFKDCSYDNKDIIGGKCSSLGELYNLSERLKFNISDGFAITTYFYDKLLEENDLEDFIKRNLSSVEIDDISSIENVSKKIKDRILNSEINKTSLKNLKMNLTLLLCMKENSSVAVRSSAVAEDLPNASFAGQQDTYLNIDNFEDFMLCVKKCIASLFNVRAISYRLTNEIPYSMVKISIAVQLMIRSDLGSAGVAFSIDPETGYEKAIVINSNFGLGESVVSGLVLPDEYIVDKRSLNEGFEDPIIKIKLGQKQIICKYSENGSEMTELDKENQMKHSLKNKDIIEIGRIVSSLERSYKNYFKCKGVDVEWALDGIDNKIYIIQARPETVHSNNNKMILKTYHLNSETKPEIIATGVSVGCMISSGKVKILTNPSQHNLFSEGDILVTDYTTPDWEPIMKKSSGIITNKGGRTCHAAIIARELRINTIVGVGDATEKLKNDNMITIDNSKGEVGYVYSGKHNFTIESLKISKNLKLPVNMMFNVGNPDNAFKGSLIPNKGIGLARLEFIISNNIKIHPLAIINYYNLRSSNKPENQKLVNTISKIIKNQKPKDFFVQTLARDIGKLASAFYPNDVIVRLSDFKSNEYKNLIGGELYEPEEENPMIGWRGASRYYDPKYMNAFKLECEAIKYVREKMGMKNVIVMIPFCRTPEECSKVLTLLMQFGIPRGKDGMKVYLMCEIPSNVIEADNFAPLIDGVSIGGNDLLQLTLGVDRDGDLVSHLSKDTNVSYRRLISKAIKDYKELNVKVGFCGQQPSDSIEFCKFLIDEGIDSISVIPDSGLNLIDKLGKI